MMSSQGCESSIVVQKQLILKEGSQQYLICPICGRRFNCSDYLGAVISNERVLWFANMITHFRHDHIPSWNKCWGYNGHRYRKRWFGDYDEEKAKVNERAKRQIIRKGRQFLLDNGFTVDHIQQLQNNKVETIVLAEKLLRLNNRKRIRKNNK